MNLILICVYILSLITVIHIFMGFESVNHCLTTPYVRFSVTGNVFPVSYLKPCFLLSSPRFDFPPPVDNATLNPHNSFHNIICIPLPSFSAPGSHQFVFIVYFVVHLLLSSLLLYSNSGLSTDVFSYENEYTHTPSTMIIYVCGNTNFEV